MTHAHHWRATSKVFARVCDCGVAYHDWLLMENEWLLSEVDSLKAAVQTSPATPNSTEEITALRAQLEKVQREAAELRSDLDLAHRELATRTKSVSNIDPACTGSLVHDEFTVCPVHR